MGGGGGRKEKERERERERVRERERERDQSIAEGNRMSGSRTTADSGFLDAGSSAVLSVLELHEKSLYHYNNFSIFCLDCFSGFLFLPVKEL